MIFVWLFVFFVIASQVITRVLIPMDLSAPTHRVNLELDVIVNEFIYVGLVMLVPLIVYSLFYSGSRFGSKATAHALTQQIPRPLDDARLLPAEGQAIVRHIMATLEEIRSSDVRTSISSEANYVLRQMDTQYVPSVLSAYLAIPKSRQAAFNDKLLEQLRVLATQTDRLLDNVTSDRANALDVTQRFLDEKFGSPKSAFQSLSDQHDSLTIAFPKGATES